MARSNSDMQSLEEAPPVRIEFSVRRHKKHLINVVIFDFQYFQFAVKKNMSVGDLFHNICTILHLEKDREYFGLSQMIDGHLCLLDKKIRLSKVLQTNTPSSTFFKNRPLPYTYSKNEDCPSPPSNRLSTIESSQEQMSKQSSSRNSSLTVSTSSVVRSEVYFCVQYFLPASSVHTLQDATAKYLYHLHLRHNHLCHSFNAPLECHLQLCAMALQVDYGDFNSHRRYSHQSKKPSSSYFDPKDYLPLWVIDCLGVDYLRQHIPKLHQELRGMSENQAITKYIRMASSPPQSATFHMYPFKDVTCSPEEKTGAHKTCHLYLGLCYDGIAIFQGSRETDSRLSQTSLLPWLEIGSLHISKNKLFLRLNCPSRRLLKFQTKEERFVQTFFELSHKMYDNYSVKELERLTHISRERDEEEDVYKENYIYSSTDELHNARSRKSYQDLHETQNASSTSQLCLNSTIQSESKDGNTSVSSHLSSSTQREWSAEPVRISRDDVGHKRIHSDHIPSILLDDHILLEFSQTHNGQ